MISRLILGSGAMLGHLQLQVLIDRHFHTYSAEIFEGHELEATAKNFAYIEAAELWAGNIAREIRQIVPNPSLHWRT